MGTSDERENFDKTGKIDAEVFARVAAEKRKKIEELLRGTDQSMNNTGRVNKDLIRFGVTEEMSPPHTHQSPSTSYSAGQKSEPETSVSQAVKTETEPVKQAGNTGFPLTKAQKAKDLGILPFAAGDSGEITEEIKVYDGTLPLGSEVKYTQQSDTPPRQPEDVSQDLPLENQVSLEEALTTQPEIPTRQPVHQQADQHPLMDQMDTHELLRMARQEKINNFVSVLEIPDEIEEDESPVAQPQEAKQEEDIFEYMPDSDADEIEGILVKSRSRRLIQIIVTAGLALLSLGVLFADKLPISLFALTGDASADSLQIMLQTGVLLFMALVAFLVNVDAMGDGARNFIHLNASQESAALIVWIACVIQGVLVATDTDSLKGLNAAAEGYTGAIYGLYLPMAIIAIMLSQIGAYFRQTRELYGFKTLRSNSQMQHLRLQNIGDSTLMERPKGEADCAVAVYVPADFSSGFFAMSDTEDMSDRTNRPAVPLVMALSFLIGLFAWLTDSERRPIVFVTAFAAINTAVMPIASAILACLPQSRAAKANAKKGIVITNQCAYDDAVAATSLVVSDEELFPVGSVLLHGIKTFNGKRMDEAIVIAASAVDKHGGPLKHMFAGILSENEDNCLLEVDSEAVFEPERGLISWIMGKRVLIGNREFLLEYDIELPDKEYEVKFLKKGYTPVYLALGGELMAMFVVSYHLQDQTIASLRSLAKKRVKILVDAKDSSITSKLIARQLRIPVSCVTVMNMEGKKTAERLSARASSLKTGVACSGGAAEKADALSSCFKIRRMTTMGFVLEAGFLIVALIIAVLFIFFRTYEKINLPFILMYQLIWLTASILIQMLGRYKNP